MKTLSQIADTLGPPQMLREVRSDFRGQGAVARWRHGGAFVDLRGTDSFQLIFNISGGQVVELYSRGSSIRRAIRAGSLFSLCPGDVEGIRITGNADTLQFLITRDLIASITGGRPAAPFQLATCHSQLRAFAAQAVVALARNRLESDAELDTILVGIAHRFAHPDVLPVDRSRGGLSTGARRRVSKLIDDRLDHLPHSYPSLSELAAAARLSVHHFIKAFRQSEGETPHARVTACRIDKALELLLRAHSRVDQVAELTGFSSPSHFVSVFRTRVGATPGAFRDAAHFSL